MRLFPNLFKPTVQGTRLLEITSIEECRKLFGFDLAILFKHSKQCNVSRAAYRTVGKFSAMESAPRVYLISVRDSRAVSSFVETETGVVHESPQVIAITMGKVLAHASHRAITATFLQQFAIG